MAIKNLKNKKNDDKSNNQNSNYKAIHIIASGRVQGVFYRDFVKKQAIILRINGWAKNNLNGKVEIIAQGNESDLRAFVDKCQEGPTYARVNDLEITEEKIKENFSDFEIR